MHKCIKKQISPANINLKRSKKAISILVVLLLLSTLLSTVVSSRSSLFNPVETESNDDERPLKKLLERVKDRLEELKEKIQNIRDKLANLKNKTSDLDEDKPTPDVELNPDNEPTKKRGFFQSFIDTLQELGKNKANMTVYTKYTDGKAEHEKETILTLGGLFIKRGKVEIDVNNDNNPDIKVIMRIRPGIETKPLALSLNFILIIERLNDFPEENAFFEVYTEFKFPGVIIKAQKGDKIRFGYESPSGEEVPDHCTVTYKYVPYFLRLKLKPEHRINLDPGSADNNSKLVLLLGYVNAKNNTIASELNSRIIFDPAVIAELSIGGEGILGGRTFEFKQIYHGISKINMTCSFEKNDTTIYGYVCDLPKEVTFTIDLGAEGYIEFNTNGEKPSEIGICDDFYNPVNRIFFTNLPSIARLEWTRDLLTGEKVNISAFTDSPGIALNGYLESPNNGTFDFSIVSAQHLDFLAELDLSLGELLVKRSNVDLTFDISAKGANNGTIDLSFNLQRIFDKDFKIKYGELLDSNMEISFSTNEFIINDFYFLVKNNTDDSSIELSLKKIIKNQGGNINFSLETEKNDENITFRITLEITNGLEIQDLLLGFNGSWTNQPWSYTFTGNVIYTFEIQLYSGFNYYIADDFSRGYFSFKGNFSLSSYRTFMHNNTECGFKGKIYMKSDYDELNFSWYTVNESGVEMKKFSLTGMLFGLEDFHLYISDIINFSIPFLQGSIEIIEACRKSGYVEFELKGSQTFLDLDFSFNITGEGGLDFNLTVDDFHIDIPDREVHLSLAWADYNVSSLKFKTETDINLNLKNLKIHLINLSSSETIFLLDNLTGYLEGKNLGFNVDLSLPINIHNSTDLSYIDLSDNPLAFELTDVDVDFSIEDIKMASFSFGEIAISAVVEDTVSFSLQNISFVNMTELFGVPLGEKQSYIYINLTFGLDASKGNFNLNRLKISDISSIINIVLPMLGLPLPLNETAVIIEDLIIKGYSDFTVSLGLFNSNPGQIGMRFDNDVASSFSIGRMGLAFPQGLLLGMGPGIPTTAFLENVVLIDGVFDLRLNINPSFSFSIDNGTAIDNVDFVLEIPDDLLILNLTIDEPIEHLKIEYNPGWSANDPPYDQYILLDTHDTSIWFDGSFNLKKELINYGIDLLNGLLNTSIPYVLKDQGLRFENVTFAADSFKVFLNSSAYPKFDGRLELSGEGKIYYLVDDAWEEILPGGDGFYLMLENGHLQILFDLAAENTTVYYEKVLETGEHLIISGSFTIFSDNLTVDIWWDLETGYLNITTNIDVGLIIEDFSFEIDEAVNVQFASFNITKGTFTAEFDIIEKLIKVGLGGSLVTLDGFDLLLYNTTTGDSITFDFDHFEFLGGQISISTPENNTLNLETTKEINWFKWTGFDFTINNFGGGFSSLAWTKQQSILLSASFNLSEKSGEIEIDRYTDQDSSLNLTNAYIKYQLTPKIILKTILRSFEILYQKNTHEYFYLSWIQDEYINLTADIAASWNITFERLFNIMNSLTAIDLISSTVDVNFSLHYRPSAEINVEDPTANQLILNILEESSIELLEIVNNLIIRKDKALSIGSLELQPGEITFDWLIDNDTGTGWIIIDNDQVTGDFTGLKLNKGSKQIKLLDVSLVEPGETRIEFEIIDENGSFYTLNSAKIECTLLEFSKEGALFRIERATELGIITIQPGEFKANWVNISDEKYDKEILINNGIFKFSLVKCTIILENIEISCSFGDTDPDYSNDITLKLRNQGPKNRALYIDTGSGVQLDAFVFGISSADWNIEIDILELKVDFDGFYIGYFGEGLEQGGDIDLSINKYLNITFSWKDENSQNQKLFLNYEKGYMGNPHARAITLDTMNCIESIDIDFATKLVGVDIIGTVSIYPQRNMLWHFDFNPNKHSGETEGNGHFYIDTNNLVMGNLSITVSKYIDILDTTFGLKVELDLLNASEFYIHGKFTKTSEIYLPFDWEKSGSIYYISGTIHFQINDTFIRIWPLTPLAVLNKDVYGVTPENPTVTFDMSGSEDYIFKIRWMQWDFGNGSGWTPWMSYPKNKKYSHDFTWMFNKGQETADIKFKVKTIAAESNVVLATVQRGYTLDVVVKYSGYKLYEFDEFIVSVTNTTSGLPVSGATVTYNQSNQDGTWDEITNTTDINGEACFEAFSVPYDYYTHYSLAKAFAEADGYFGGNSGSFRVYDTEAELNGYVKDNVTHIGIPNALIVAEPGEYNTTSEEYPGGMQNGTFLLMVPPGTYDITASEDDYESATIEDVEAIQGDAINLGDMYLPPLNYGGLRGTVYDAINDNDRIRGVTVTVEIDEGDDIETKTSDTGVFPAGYPSYSDSYYSIDLTPGTYTVRFEMDNYYTYEEEVTIYAGEVTDIDVYLYQVWVTPKGHNNPSEWDNEEDAHDDRLNTIAYTKFYVSPFGQWTQLLELELSSPLTCDRIRFYAKQIPNRLEKVKIEIFYDEEEEWYEVYTGNYSHKEWVIKDFTEHTISKARISFRIKCIIPTRAELYEFDFGFVNPNLTYYL